VKERREKIRAYTSAGSSAFSFLQEVRGLHRYYRQAPELARKAVEDVRNREAQVKEHLGLDLRDLDILEIGPGQLQSHAKYLALNNRVTGIDLDTMAQSMAPQIYFEMLRTNGLRRTLKTLGRKLLGTDRKFATELRRQIGVERLPKLKIIQMDACQMTFADESFDFVYARSVFHHLPDPAAALEGIGRVLRPGGGAYLILHLYTSETGCLDPRIHTSRRKEVQGWPHLRPASHTVLYNDNTYLNKLRLHEWRALFNSKLPDAKYFTTAGNSATVESARDLQSRGELLDYSLEELITYDLAVIWRKPARPNPGQSDTCPQTGR
jgi:SAM-dependent methyltransferase